MSISKTTLVSGASFTLGTGLDSSNSANVQLTGVLEPTGGTIIIPAQDGTDGTGITAPTGGVGIRGWLSGIYNKLAGTVAVSAASLPLPTGAAQDGTDGTGITPPTGGAGIRGWLSGIFNLLGQILTASTNPIPAGVNTTIIGSVGIDPTKNTVAITTPGRTPASESSTAGNTAIAASIPAVAGQYSYLSAVFLSGLGATTAATVQCNITNVLSSNATSNTWTFQIAVPQGVTVPLFADGPKIINFDPPLQAKAINTQLQVNIGAFGAGNTQQCVGVSGYNSVSATF